MKKIKDFCFKIAVTYLKMGDDTVQSLYHLQKNFPKVYTMVKIRHFVSKRDKQKCL